MSKERFFLCLFSVPCLALSFFFADPGYAQQQGIVGYPNRPINLLVPMPAGGGTDLAVRLLAKETEKFLGEPIVVVNKPGGSQTVATAQLATSKPDGYTIGYTSHLGLFSAPLKEKVPYHPVKDLRQIIQFGSTNIAVIVKGDSTFADFKDIVAYARQNPKKLTYGSAGVGSLGHLALEQIAIREKVQFIHIPFKGSPETQAALLGGHILVGTGDFNSSLLEAGQIKLLLIIAEEHAVDYPHTPILKDLGYDIPAPTLMSIACPKNTPDEIVRKLEGAFTKAIKEPTFIRGMKDLRYAIVYRNSKSVEEYVAYNYDAFAKVLKEMGLTK
ncbi:MAG: tripartite tricarboxylate transporter substrate binding protein [Syntrophales bacterium LBB04]|nr:tripartite tricarboxylate transporter substrate binding protein [Syntrophales bacterium LBB04]